MREKVFADLELRRQEMEYSRRALGLETHGSVRKAAIRATVLYLGSPIPRTLKQCIAIAANEHVVAWGAIQAYLAGVGARVLWAEDGGEDDGGNDVPDSGPRLVSGMRRE